MIGILSYAGVMVGYGFALATGFALFRGVSRLLTRAWDWAFPKPAPKFPSPPQFMVNPEWVLGRMEAPIAQKEK